MRSEEKRRKFIKDLFITCDRCGYNNYKKRLQSFGTCLCCGNVIDEKAYFRARLKMKNVRVRNKE